jgi:hypothetical protein
MKAAIIGAITIISIVAAVLVFSINPATQIIMPQAPAQTLQQYVGTVESGSSFFHNGEAICEFTFQDGRTFTAPEQMARQANMKIGSAYRVFYNQTAPSVAVAIQEENPK